MPFERIGQRLQRTVVGAAQYASTAAVVEQCVDGFLQHALFVPNDDLGRVQIHQLLQPVVAVDDATVKIVQIGSGKAATIEWNQRTKLRRNHRDDIEDHPAGLVAAAAESFDHLQALRIFEALLQRTLVLHFFAQFDRQAIGVDALEKLLDSLGAHHGLEASGTVLLVEFAELRLVFDYFALFYRSVARLNYDIGLEVEHGLEVAQRNVEQVADTARQAFEEPHVRAGRSQLDVPQAFAADLRERDFHATLVADYAAMLHALVFAAEALPISYRAKDAGAEQSVPLRLEGAIVNGLRLGDFAVRPAPDFFRRRQANADGIEIRNRILHFERARTKQGVPPLSSAMSSPLTAPGREVARGQ